MIDAFDRVAAARLTIDLDALVRNYRRIEAEAAPARTAAVVKANAYGLGAVQVASALYQAGCTDFFVAQISEVEAVLGAVGATARIFVLNGLPVGTERDCADMGAIPVLNSLDQIARWNDLAATLGRRLPGVVQLDSGMGRFGLSPAELDLLHGSSDRLASVDVVLVMSHLACADDPHSPANEAQRARFDTQAALFPDVPRSLSNSGGAFLGRGFHGDLVRAGIALYGAPPQQGVDNPMAPVVGLVADIVQVRMVPAGDGIGYGLTASADHDRHIAAISVGYADGWPRRLGNRGSAFIDGVRVPIVGRVSMDSMLIDVTALADAVRPGDPVELIGPCQSLADVAADADTIAYEILTQLGSRYARRYLGGAASATSRSSAR